MVLSAESMPLDRLFRAMGKLNCQGVWQLPRELGAASLEGVLNGRPLRSG